MRPVSPFHSSYLYTRGARVALAAAAVAGLVVIAACTDNGDKSITAPPGLRNSSSSSGEQGSTNPLSMAGRVKLCVDPSSPVGEYTFAYTGQNDQAALDGNRFLDGGFWTDEGGDWQNPTNPSDGSTTVFNTITVISNNGDATPDCLLVLTRTVASLAFRTAIANSQTAIDSWSGVTITYVSNNVIGGANYLRTDCILDPGVLIPEHTIPNPLSIPLWSGATNFAAGDLTRTDSDLGTANHGDRIWRAIVANTGVAPTEGTTWSTANLGDCGTNGNPTRAFANFEHGTVVTFVFEPAPTTSTGIIAPTATTCANYRDGNATTEPGILVGLRSSGVINNAAPGVFFYYAHVNTTGLGDQTIGFTQSISSSADLHYLYAVQQTQAYLYNQSCQVVATFPLNAAGTLSSGLLMPAANYILGIKFATDAAKGKTPSPITTPLATHSYWATLNTVSQGSTSASINTSVK